MIADSFGLDPAAVKAVEGGCSVIVVEANYDIGGTRSSAAEIPRWEAAPARRRRRGAAGSP
ncbi:MAG: hypothetical protein HC774_02330 [Sphingomonadales bacterium]|nr:hypothetical protein [Sphingomonadales bacterium]